MIEEPTPEELEIARKALTRLLENIHNPQGECFQCHQSVTHKKQVGRSVYLYPCGHRYAGVLSERARGIKF
jgi:hypothetical protein